MQILKLTLLAVLALFIILLAVANRESVVVELLPAQFGFVADFSWEVPLFIVMIGMGAGGFALGWFWEWFHDKQTRDVARQRRRKIVALEREVEGLRRETGVEEDEVLALLK